MTSFDIEPPGWKVFTMAVTQNRIVVGTANRHVYVYDVRNLSEPEQKVRILYLRPFQSRGEPPGFNPPKPGG